MDPHKKTYLAYKDWNNAFSPFNESDTLMVEFKNYLLCQFSDASSAYSFILTHGNSQFANLDSFTTAIKSLIKNRNYTPAQIKSIYSRFLREPTDFANGFNEQQFAYEFVNQKFKGKQTVKVKPNPNNKGGYITTI